jgi:CRISPR-associated protein Csd2
MNMFDHDRSAARGEMAPQKLIVFKHDSELGNAPANKLFDLVKVEKNCGDNPPRSFADYTVSIGTPPSGVELIEML